MKLHIFNSLTRKKEEFIPIDDKEIKMYVCGPTVYDHPHIGNGRAIVVYDVLFRLLKNIYPDKNITYVRNITDVDDKINNRAKELKISIKELTEKTIEFFHQDTKYLQCESPTFEPKATENIEYMINIIERLLERGYAYKADNHIYYSVESFEKYGQLSGRTLDDMIAGARIEPSVHKKHPGDFVLWKPASTDDEPSSIFKSPFGDGKPGWHIECSAMSYRYLGENFDIHGGGADLIFPHHTNEIAQSCGAFNNSFFARYWIHNGFLTVDQQKMSKSLNNFITINDLRNRKVPGEVVRLLLIMTHYRKPLDYSEKALKDCHTFLDYLYRPVTELKEINEKKLDEEFLNILLNDLNTHEALTFLYELARSFHKTTSKEEKEEIVKKILGCGDLLGILQNKDVWFKQNINLHSTIDENYISEMLAKRLKAKLNQDWKLADQIRAQLLEKNVMIEDHPDGTSSWRIKK